jgi:uncharacterized protein with FMN-binding domain
MRRTIAALLGTAAVLWATLSFKSSPLPTPGALATTTTEPPTTAVPARRALRVTTTTVPPERTLVGANEPNKWGPVQVEIIVRGTQILDVRPLQLPVGHSRSAQISNQSAPYLRAEVLQAQSARINGVSGATYTSRGYAASVQSAIDQEPHGA